MQQRPEEILRIAREKKKLKQQDVADKIGITLRQYHKYESGIFPKFKSDNVKAIDMFLGTKLSELIYEHKNEDNVPVEISVDRDKLIAEFQKDFIRLEARVNFMLITLAEVVSKVDKKQIGIIDSEFSEGIDKESERLLRKLKRKLSDI